MVALEDFEESSFFLLLQPAGTTSSIYKESKVALPVSLRATISLRTPSAKANMSMLEARELTLLHLPDSKASSRGGLISQPLHRTRLRPLHIGVGCCGLHSLPPEPRAIRQVTHRRGQHFQPIHNVDGGRFHAHRRQRWQRCSARFHRLRTLLAIPLLFSRRHLLQHNCLQLRHSSCQQRHRIRC